jgi:hypothetical protein
LAVAIGDGMRSFHMSRRSIALLAITLAASSITACARSPEAVPGISESPVHAAADAASAAAATASVTAAATSLPLVVVHKSESCGCCGLWVEHMQQAGFPVQVRNLDNVSPVKERVGVPFGKGSCHTAEVGGYFVEGHVPAEDVKRLLAGKPAAKGLVVPGMPAGSPGMEMPDGRVQPYVVELVREDGTTEPFAHHGN